MGYGEEFLRGLMLVSAERNAAHLLPHLNPGQRILDFGCGPGSISVGLAKAVEPGELHGVDMEESHVDIARMVAHSQGLQNAFFHVGDVCALEFEDGYFDVVHCHNVLMHVPDTQAALAEAKRVLKPGGLIACREMIIQSSFTYPDFGIIHKSYEMFEDLIAADDGHPNMGKELKGHILKAGFGDVRSSLSFFTFSTPEEIDLLYDLANRWFLSDEIVEAAIKYGAWTRKLTEAVRDAYVKWKSCPEALVSLAHCEVIAQKPQ